jgi:tetratricopeptide (TPR) repeat protein
VAEALDDISIRFSATYTLGLAYFLQGEYGQAMECFRWIIASFDDDLSGNLFSIATGSSLFAFSHALLGLLYAECGAFAEGLACGAEGMRLAEAIDHFYSRVLAYMSVGFLYLCNPDYS